MHENELFAYHSATPDYFILKEKSCQLRLKIVSTGDCSQVFVRTEPDNEEALTEMEVVELRANEAIWQAEITYLAAEINLYAFKFIVDGLQYWLDASGQVKNYPPERDIHFRFYPGYKPAKWVWSQVFYQIFPDRFFDGDPANNVKTGEYVYEGEDVIEKNWAELPDVENGFREFYGGDLLGIRKKLPYLQDLGVNSLYLNPIFVSPSSHKYDTVDYYRIDPHFGSNKDFAKLCNELHDKEMHIILDAVLNHTSERNIWFDRYNEYDTEGAYQSKDSKYRGFYNFDSDDPESYHGWYGIRTLAVLDYGNPDLQEVVYKADDAILKHWLKAPYKIDGWRFDVIHMLGEGKGAKNNAHYVREFRKAVRMVNPEAFILGEHFFEADKWLQGDQEDGAMNYYGFSFPLWAFFAGIDHRGHRIAVDAKDMAFMLARARARLPFENQLSQINLLNSHDTSRFVTLVKADKALLKAAISMLFTYIGVPSIYYGDEIGLEGGNDPDCRRTFPWDETMWDMDLLNLYKKLIALRKSSLTLQEGGLVELLAEGDIFVFARARANENIITILNRGTATKISIPVWKIGIKNQPLKSFFSAKIYKAKNGFLECESLKGSEILIA